MTDELLGQGRKRLLTVWVNLAFFTAWLATRLAEFRALHPEVGLHFTSNIWLDERGKEADLAIRYGQGVWPGMKSSRLTWDELFPVCSPQLANGEKLPPTSPAELLAHTLLHMIGYEEGWGYWLNQTGFHHVDPSREMQFDTLITALAMAALGHGLALGRTSLVAGMLASGRLIAPFSQRIATSEAFFLTCPAHQYMASHAEAFWSWLITQAEQGRETTEQAFTVAVQL